MSPGNCSGSYSAPPRASAIAWRSSSPPSEVDATTFSILIFAIWIYLPLAQEGSFLGSLAFEGYLNTFPRSEAPVPPLGRGFRPPLEPADDRVHRPYIGNWGAFRADGLDQAPGDRLDLRPAAALHVLEHARPVPGGGGGDLDGLGGDAVRVQRGPRGVGGEDPLAGDPVEEGAQVRVRGKIAVRSAEDGGEGVDRGVHDGLRPQLAPHVVRHGRPHPGGGEDAGDSLRVRARRAVPRPNDGLAGARVDDLAGRDERDAVRRRPRHDAGRLRRQRLRVPKTVLERDERALPPERTQRIDRRG